MLGCPGVRDLGHVDIRVEGATAGPAGERPSWTIPSVTDRSPTYDGATLNGIGRAKAQQVWYRAPSVCMTSSTDYKAARTAPLKAAAGLYGSGSTEYNQVAAHLDRRQRQLTERRTGSTAVGPSTEGADRCPQVRTPTAVPGPVDLDGWRRRRGRTGGHGCCVERGVVGTTLAVTGPTPAVGTRTNTS